MGGGGGGLGSFFWLPCDRISFSFNRLLFTFIYTVNDPRNTESHLNASYLTNAAQRATFGQ